MMQTPGAKPSSVRMEVQALKHDVNELRQQVTALQCAMPGEAVSRLLLLVDGDPSRDVSGLRQRIVKLEGAVESLQEDKKGQQNTLRGIAIGLGLTGITGAGTFITMLMQVFK